MKAIQFTEYGGYDRLALVTLPTPTPSTGEVLVRITAATVTPADNNIRLGRIPFAKRPPHIPGNAAAGVVEVAGDSGLPVGTRVVLAGFYGFEVDGTWREYIAVPPYEVVPIPDSLTDVQAAGVMEAYLTAYVALVIHGEFRPEQPVLIPGVGGGIGNAAVQLARALGGRQVLTTAGSTAKAEQARENGYQNVIDLAQESLTGEVKRLTGGGGVALALDSIGGNLTGQVIDALAPGGTAVLVGTAAGSQATINLLSMIWKGTRMVASSPGDLPPDQMEKAGRHILKLLAEGAIQPLVSRTFPLEQAAEAVRYMVEDRPFGRVILTL